VGDVRLEDSPKGCTHHLDDPCTTRTRLGKVGSVGTVDFQRKAKSGAGWRGRKGEMRRRPSYVVLGLNRTSSTRTLITSKHRELTC